MSAIEIKKATTIRRCAGGCKTQENKGRYPRSGTKQVYLLGHPAGHWCNGCAKKWQELFDDVRIEDTAEAA